MPAPILDFYSRFFQRMFDNRKIISISKGFQAFFGNRETDDPSETDFIFDKKVFDIDIIKGDKPIAAMVPRGISGMIVDDPVETDQKWSEFNRTLPLARKSSFIKADTLTDRLPGEMPNSNLTRADRLRAIAGKKYMSLIRQHMGLMELLASLSVLTGKMPAILGAANPDLEYDFRRDAANFVDASPDWPSATLEQIMGDIDDGADAVSENGKVNPDMLIFGRDIWATLLSKTGIEKYFDLRRIDQGSITLDMAVPPRFQRFVGNGGFLLRGKLITPKGRELWLFSYDQFYTDENADPVYYMSGNLAVIAYSGARCDRIFGTGESLPETRIKRMWYEDMFGFSPADNPPMPDMTPNGDIFRPEMFHFRAYPSTDETTIWIDTETAPVFITTQTDAFAVIDTDPP